MFRAAYELYNAARTDPELAAGIASAHNQAAALTQAAAAQVVPELATMPGFADWVLVALSTLRGAAFVSAIPGTAAGLADWPSTRTHLLYSLDRLIAEAGSKPLRSGHAVASRRTLKPETGSKGPRRRRESPAAASSR